MHSPQSTASQILHILKERSGEHVSGTFLAARLGVTRTAVWKHVAALRSIGYDIESHPKRGYKLVTIPDLLLPEEIIPFLRTSWLGHTYRHYSSVESTNDVALSLAAQGYPHGTVVVAEEQTKGRGRLRRPWLSSSHRGIYMTMLLTTPLPVRNAPQTTLVAGLALIDALRNQYGLQATVKWPNDVLVHHEKVAGILTEMQSDQELTRFLIIGVGVNANHTEEELQGPFRYPATSLAIQLKKPVKRHDLLIEYLDSFERRYDAYVAHGFSVLLPELQAASATIGQDIEVHFGTFHQKGKALGFTPEGALRLLTESGKEEIIWVGDVSLVEGNA